MITGRRDTRARHVTLGITLAVVAFTAVPSRATAHGDTTDATNYLSTVTDSGAEGLKWSVHGGDSLIELDNRTGELVVVRGYQGEAYLEFRPDATVWVNLRSPAHYQNTTRYATSTLPAQADAAAAPEWQQVAGHGRYSWHDHRIHWMSPLEPQGVDADPTHDQRVLGWTIPLSVGGHPVESSGELWWIAPDPWWPPVVIPATILLIVGVAAIARSKPIDGGTRRPGATRPVVVVIGLVGAANVIGTVDHIVASPASPSEQIAVSVGTAVTLASIAALCRAAWRGTGGGHLALVGAGLATTLIFGVEATEMLTASQITTVLPLWVRRVTVGTSCAVIVPVTVVAVAAVRQFAVQIRHAVAGRSPESRSG